MTQGASPDVRSIFAQAVGHHQAGRLDEAIACYRQVLVLKPDLARRTTISATRFANRENWKRPKPAIAARWPFSPTWPSAHNNLGTVFLEQDKLDEAVACYREALPWSRTMPRRTTIWAPRLPAGKLDEAETSIRRALF